MMKAFFITCLTCILLISLATIAPAQVVDIEPVKPAEKPHTALRAEVVKMIRYANLTGVPRQHRDATIDFLVTNDDQLLVLNIDTFSPYLKRFIKERLNYKPIHVEGVKKLTTYSLDVKFMVKG